MILLQTVYEMPEHFINYHNNDFGHNKNWSELLEIVIKIGYISHVNRLRKTISMSFPQSQGRSHSEFFGFDLTNGGMSAPHWETGVKALGATPVSPVSPMDTPLKELALKGRVLCQFHEFNRSNKSESVPTNSLK